MVSPRLIKLLSLRNNFIDLVFSINANTNNFGYVMLFECVINIQDNIKDFFYSEKRRKLN